MSLSKIGLRALLLSSLSLPAMASDFDGWRLSLEGAVSSSRVRIDAGAPRAAGLERFDRGIASGEEAIGRAGDVRRVAADALATQEGFQREAARRLAGLEAARQNYLLSAPGSVSTPFDAGIASARSALSDVSDLVSWTRRDIASLDGAIGTANASLVRAQADRSALQMTSPVSRGEGSGFGVRIGAGYTRSFGRIQLGVEGDVQQDSHDARVNVLGRRQVGVQFDTMLGLQGRVGYRVNEWLLPFAYAGGDLSEWRVTSGARRSTEWRPGARFGAGVEMRTAQNTLFRIAYERGVTGETGDSGVRTSATRDTVRFGVVRTF